MLTRTADRPLSHQLAERFAARIRDRLLAPGARLPSVRQCAAQNGVSPSTVVAAYDQLVAGGWVEARRNRGFFIRNPASAQEKWTSSAINSIATEGTIADRTAESRHRPIDATALIRGMFEGVGDRPQPGRGVLPPDWLDCAFLPTAIRRVTGAESLRSLSLGYGEAKGDADLRRAAAKRLAQFRIDADPAQIVTTIGATHALDVVSRTLLRPGDPVMVEEPGWAVEYARLQSLGMRLLPVPRGPEGPDLAVMERYCEAHRPRLYVSVSVLHNPTGACLAPAAAHRVLQLAQRHDFHIVEDDTYSHFAPDHAVRLSALDALQRTIYVGGFAKLLAPNWRVGFLAAPPALVSALVDTKLLGTLTTPALLEKAIALCIEQGQLRRHAERIRVRLDAARARSVRLALAAGCTFAAEPAGLFGWVDTGVDTDRLAQRLLDEGYLIAPGSLFTAQRIPSTLMRINFTTTQEAGFWKVFERVVGEG